jgi:NAD(P)-dependent dehydrogenase (short-subunit alcohol dehydrogenase family)
MKASFDATGEVLIVTGGARGIGAAAARAYAEAGGTAHVFDVSPSEDASTQSGGQGGGEAADAGARSGVQGDGAGAVAGSDGEAGSGTGGAATGSVVEHRVDVADRDAVRAAVAEVVEREGRIDGLIAGAAVQPRTPLVDMDPEEWRETLAVNLDGVAWAVQAVLPTMRAARRGSIVVFSSGLAHMGRAEASAYAASKGALLPFVRSVAAEVAADRVRINVLWPGVIDTDQFRAANPGAEREHWLKTTGIGTPEDVVGAMQFLLSDAASMTGSTLTRDRVFARESEAAGGAGEGGTGSAGDGGSATAGDGAEEAGR